MTARVWRRSRPRAKATERALSCRLLGPKWPTSDRNRRIEELDGDREALEHIARALEGRVLPGPGRWRFLSRKPKPRR